MQIFNRKALENLFPILLGIFAFFLIVGVAPLNPKNINWLKAWDALENYIGWVFYRYDDWQIPIGLNPKNGLEISSSIVYSDSIPIAAILLKPFSSLLGEPFQYFGIWYLICFILQGWFSWLLIGLFSKDCWVKFLAVGLFIFAPPFMWKVGMTEMVGTHPAPASHFLIIAALYLIFNKSNVSKTWQWTLLLSVACLVNFYIFVMVFILWSSNLMDEYFLQNQPPVRRLFNQILTVMTFVILCAWQVGYFVKKGVPLGDIGYGFFRMPLLSLFDPRGWSYLISSFPQANQLDEFFHLPLEVGIVHGFQFIGIGGLIVLALAVIILASLKTARESLLFSIKEHLFLTVGLMLLTVFAVSNNVSIAQYNFHIPLPDSLVQVAGILRSSGRMFWPVFYSTLLLILAINFRYFSTKLLRIILCLCLLLQILDTSSGWLPIHERLKKDSVTSNASKFSSEIWNDLATQYGKIQSYPLKNSIFQYNWEHIARFASSKQIATNAVYLARIDENKVGQSNQNFIEALKTRDFDNDTIYILDDSLLVPTLMYMKPQEDLLAIIPNFLTFIPNKNLCNACPRIPKEWELSYSTSQIRASNPIKFDSSNPYLIPLLGGGHGWERQDDRVFFPKSGEVKLVIPIGDASDKFIDLNFEYPKGVKMKPSTLDISVDAKTWQSVNLKKSKDGVILPVPVSESSIKDGFISISLKKTENQDSIKLRLVFAKFR